MRVNLATNDFSISWAGYPLLSFKKPHGAGPRAVEGKVILVATLVVIEGVDQVGRGFEIIETDTGTWITLLVDRTELTVAIFQDPYGARARTVEGKMIKLAALVIIEGKGKIGSGFKIVSTDAYTRITLLVDRGETPILVTEDPDCTRSRAVEGKVVKLATRVVIKREGTIVGRS